MKFKKGDKVRISEKSEYYGVSKSNPRNVTGEVYCPSDDENVWIGVKWENGTLNSYKEHDLIHWLIDFQVGDKVRAFGCDGEVKHVWREDLEVEFEGGHYQRFFLNGTYYHWHKEPSLVLIERPVKKVKKVFRLYSTKEGTLCDMLLDEKGYTPSGKHGDWVENMVKIPGTEVTLEVVADSYYAGKVDHV